MCFVVGVDGNAKMCRPIPAKMGTANEGKACPRLDNPIPTGRPNNLADEAEKLSRLNRNLDDKRVAELILETDCSERLHWE